MAPKKDVKSSESDGKVSAKWDDNKTETFLKICFEEITAGNRPTSHFNKEGWKNIREKFQERTSFAYDHNQLKNRWDSLKRDYQSFAKLVEKQTGVGWDYEKQTVIADDEWWATKSKEEPDILKWKKGGPKFLELLEKCFKGNVATGFAIFKPYQDPPPFEASNVHTEDVESRDRNPITEDEGQVNSIEVDEEGETPSSSNMNLRKRKNLWKGEKIGTAEKLQRTLELLVDGMDDGSSSNVTSNSEDVGYGQCLKMLDEVPFLVKASSLYYKAVRILANKENRIAFSHFMAMDPSMVHDWLDTFKDFPRAH